MASALETVTMARAIALSAFGLGTTSPNPPVGCVVLDRDGQPAGEGYHERKGEDHAEARALRAAGKRALGGTAVVTLEPCNHEGRTPACRQTLIEAGIARVVISVLDPTSRGKGGAVMLRQAGVSVEIGVRSAETRLVLGAWLASLPTRRPYVTWIHGVDPRGQSRPLTALALSSDEIRRATDAVLISPDQAVEGVPGGHGADAFDLPTGPLKPDPAEALSQLHQGGARSVLLDGDVELAQPFLTAGLVDHIVVHLATPDGALDPSIDLLLHGGVPSGFTISGVFRTPGGVRLEATRDATGS